MREKDIENRLIAKLAAIGWRCDKWKSPGRNGVPDRICLGPNFGEVAFAETKRPGEALDPLQEIEVADLRARGFMVRVIDSYAAADQMARDLKEFGPRGL